MLISGQEIKSPVLCLVCWQHIHDFYSFQQGILEAHSKLEDVKEIVSVVKEEELDCIDDKTTSPKEDILDKELKYESEASELEAFGLEDDRDTFSSEDERPLIERAERELKAKKFIKAKRSRKIIKEEKSKTNVIKKPKKRESTKRKSKSMRDTDDTAKSEQSNDAKLSDNNDETVNNNTNDKVDTQQKTAENDEFIAAWKSDLECAKCNNSSFANFTLLRKHFLQEHSDEKCYIVCCDRKFRSRYHIVEHIRLHMDPNAYRCHVCGRCSTNSRNLAKHIKELHSEEGKQRSLECPTCLKILANKNSLRVHMETHETNLAFVCRECGKGFPSEQKRTLHERYVHNASLICDQCGKALHNPYAMKQHMLQHAGALKRKWPCDMCPVELNSRSGLKRHKQLIHQDGSTVYVCSECGKVATTEISLLTHKKNVHLSGRKHKCTICEKAFKFPRVLREHMATHTGVDLYQCPHCERTFKTNANMHHHRKKAHPQEWAEGRLNRPQVSKVDFNLVRNEVVL